MRQAYPPLMAWIVPECGKQGIFSSDSAYMSQPSPPAASAVAFDLRETDLFAFCRKEVAAWRATWPRAICRAS